jgi:hypothetical protein
MVVITVYLIYFYVVEIYQKVKNGLKPYFRPTLEECDCPSTLRKSVLLSNHRWENLYYYPIIVEKICIIIQNIVEKICIIIQSTLLKIIYKNKVVVISSLKAWCPCCFYNTVFTLYYPQALRFNRTIYDHKIYISLSASCSLNSLRHPNGTATQS